MLARRPLLLLVFSPCLTDSAGGFVWLGLLEGVAFAAGGAANGTLLWCYLGKPLTFSELHGAGAPSELLLALFDRNVLTGALLGFPSAFCGQRVGDARYWSNESSNSFCFRDCKPFDSWFSWLGPWRRYWCNTHRA